MMTISNYSRSFSLRPHRDKEMISVGEINHFNSNIFLQYSLESIAWLIHGSPWLIFISWHFTLYKHNFQPETTGCIINGEKQEQETCKKTILSHGFIFSISIWVYISVCVTRHRRLIVWQTKFHVGVAVKKTFLSPICHDLRLANDMSETTCRGSFPHGFPTGFTWSLYASLTDSVIVWIVAVG